MISKSDQQISEWINISVGTTRHRQFKVIEP